MPETGKFMDVLELYNTLFTHFGAQGWWPGDTPEEIVTGAVLTQNTAWANVEKAIQNLKEAHILSARGIMDAPIDQLTRCIRPSGYYNQKAARLQLFFRELLKDYGDIGALASLPLPESRKWLLARKGIGPETADSILLYACNKTIFVIDAYTRRISSRIPLCQKEVTENYADLQAFFMDNLPSDSALYNEYHALFVALGKYFCRPVPRCSECPVVGCRKGK